MKMTTKRMIALALAVTLVVTLVIAMAGCNPAPSNVHKHEMGWRMLIDGHTSVCTAAGCPDEVVEDSEPHEMSDGVCTVCGLKKFNVLGISSLYQSTSGDGGHITFGKEAVQWFTEVSEGAGFNFTPVNNFNNLTDEYLENVDVVMFLDNMPGNQSQKDAFEKYMRNGGGFLGWHVSAGAFGDAEAKWNWYFNEFLGTGNYRNNTWYPTIAKLKINTNEHFVTKNLPDSFIANPNEWYGWEKDLYANPDITVLASLHEDTFPLGDGGGGGGLGEVWNQIGNAAGGGTSGEWYDNHVGAPVAWSNNNYNMVYVNWGHNANSSPVSHSYTFSKHPDYPYNIAKPSNERGTWVTHPDEDCVWDHSKFPGGICRFATAQKLVYEDNSHIQNRFILDALFGMVQK